jgi:hypothetical protein
MPATARSLARLGLLVALTAPLFAADTHQEMLDLLASLAGALSEGNGIAFLDHVDHAMPDYGRFEQNILALTEQNEVTASIDIIQQDGDENAQTLELDWFLEIHSRERSGTFERRRKMVKCRVERQKKKWKIVALDPLTLFAPQAVR